jgi:wobble nucleotide-excising tRNase
MPDAVFTTAVATLADLQQAAVTYNEVVTAANGVISAKKAATQAADVRALQTDLNGLRAARARHEATGAVACKDLQTAPAEKDGPDHEKDTAKKRLDDYAKDVMAQYEKTINRLLGEFQAGFRITGTSQSYAGGTVSSSYTGDQRYRCRSRHTETGLDTPSFRNTLSAGDKSTLALAFFLAQLDDLEDLKEYTKRYHHDDNPNAATEPISDTELQGKVRLSLELTGGA